MNPGPVNVTARVRKALLGSDICHREPEFSNLLKGIKEKLLTLFGIARTHQIAVFTGSGTTALEAMLSSLADNHKKILVLSNGVYGERIQSILKVYGTPVRTLEAPLGEFPSEEKIEFVLKHDHSIHAVAMVHHETSTGMLNPLAEVAGLAKKYDKLFIVDAISSLGAEAIDFKKYPIDALAGTSGKCLHGFPGVSFVFLSHRAAQRLKTKKARSFSLDLLSALNAASKNDTAFTPAVQIFYAFDEALNELKNEGVARRIARYKSLHALIESGFEALGVSFLIEKSQRSHVLTALWTPQGLSYETLHDTLKKQGFVIYAGQSALKGKIFRISNLGEIRPSDVKRFFAVLKPLLKK